MRRNNTNRVNGMRGAGVLDVLVDTVDKFFKGQTYPGERHIISLSGPTQGRIHSYTGPGTNLSVRLAKGDQPINELDRAAMHHDIAYSNSLQQFNKDNNKKEHMQRVWGADNTFVSQAFSNKDDPRTAKVAGSLIKTKQLAEKAGILPTSVFSGAGSHVVNTPHDPLHRLRQEVVEKEDDTLQEDDYIQEGGIPIGPIISILATIGPPLVEMLWKKVHGSGSGKGSGSLRGSGSSTQKGYNLSTEEKRALLIHQMTNG
jgi:hypothetical protein